MKYLIKSINSFDNNITIPKKYIKNKYSKLEYYLIKKGLKEFFDIDKFELDYSRNGKPFLNNNVFISISHSEDLVIVAFSKNPIGVDLEYKKVLPKSLNTFLKLDKNLDNIEVLKEFCKREAIIKLEDKTLKSINDLNVLDYKYEVNEKENYLFVIVKHK